MLNIQWERLSRGSLAGLVKKATADGLPADTGAVIFATKDIKGEDSCSEFCYLHGQIGNIIALSPPSGEESADAMVIHFAAALAATVTNPYDTVLGFSVRAHYLVTARGRVRIDPKNGIGFNAHGLNHSNYLLPAVWDLNDSSCLTTV
ncbi:hypothetical protein RJ640_028411 [Escallonia rubra]|uniref:Uncharacterized protein n=1 Tax=Escallonia rubra TaxID=112253 RepID=A0AA88UCQ8_9ASTE|nr:hypothetical protein RJ640_028411 [Escallonia rubra]